MSARKFDRSKLYADMTEHVNAIHEINIALVFDDWTQRTKPEDANALIDTARQLADHAIELYRAACEGRACDTMDGKR